MIPPPFLLIAPASPLSTLLLLLLLSTLTSSGTWETHAYILYLLYKYKILKNMKNNTTQVIKYAPTFYIGVVLNVQVSLPTTFIPKYDPT